MGTRLYPNTEDTAIQEQCAGVPAGTADCYDRVVAMFCQSRGVTEEHELSQDEGFQLYQLLHNDLETLGKWRDFVLFGWGKVRGEIAGYAGTAQEEQAEQLLIAQGIEDPKIRALVIKHGGVCWS